MSHPGVSVANSRALLSGGQWQIQHPKYVAVASLLGLSALLLMLTGCGIDTASGAGGGKVQVVAAENFWGSIAAQVGGDKVHVTSIIVNPDTDPHDYEPRVSDGRRPTSRRSSRRHERARFP